jgi:hypothetical protein
MNSGKRDSPMRVGYVLALYFAIWSTPLAADPLVSTLHKHDWQLSQFAAPKSVLTCTPLDPLRSKCMHQPPEGCLRVRGHYVEKRVLKYLREMIAVCKRHNRRDLVWEYTAAWEFASSKIYGPLPPRPEERTGAHPSTIVTPAPSGWMKPPRYRMPLRKIVKRFTRPYQTWEISYETLECGHIVLAPAGHSLPAKSRRCAECTYPSAAKRKSVASVVPIKKAVSA